MLWHHTPVSQPLAFISHVAKHYSTVITHMPHKHDSTGRCIHFPMCYTETSHWIWFGEWGRHKPWGTEYFLLPDCLQQSGHRSYTATDNAATSAVLSLPIKDICCTQDIQFWNHINKIIFEQFSYGCNMKQ